MLPKLKLLWTDGPTTFPPCETLLEVLEWIPPHLMPNLNVPEWSSALRMQQ